MIFVIFGPVRVSLYLLTVLLVSAPIYSNDVFWRYGKDRYNRPALFEPLEVPDGTNPYVFFAQHQGYESWMMRRDGKIRIVAEKATKGSVPVLCLHKISREDNYALSPERFRSLLKYIRDDNWYIVSDYQYLNGDFTRVPTGKKPIVMGADDASYGNLIYQTRGSQLSGKVRRIFGKPLLDRDSMVAILEHYVQKEEGRINFTFYVSFDGIPFRQLDGLKNPGFPYADIPIVAQKIRYLDKNFRLGIHSLHHIYAYEMGEKPFLQDLKEAWKLLNEYAGGNAETVRTLAFPYGIADLSDSLRSGLRSLKINGRSLSGAFNFNNRFAPPPGAIKDRFIIDRLNVDNRNWQNLMSSLKSANAVVARRDVILETSSKRLPRNLRSVHPKDTDGIWILVRDDSSDLE